MDQTRHKFTDWAVLALASGLGVGYVPWAPGTVGSAWGLVLMWGWRQSGLCAMWIPLLLGGLLAVGIPLCGRAAALLKTADPPAVVWDEIAAFPIIFAVVPLAPISACLGFVWFRLFDILKPWPIRRLERLPGGVGIMADDLAAGLYAGAALAVSMRLFPAG